MVNKSKGSKIITWRNNSFGKSPGEITFNTILYAILLVVGAVMLYPFIQVLIESLRVLVPTGDGTIRYSYSINSYIQVITTNTQFMWSFVWTIFVALTSGALHVFCCMMTAYPLSKGNLRGRTGILLYILFTMLFGGGLVPYYLLIRDIGLMDNPLIYWVTGLVGAYNIILAKNFLNGVSSELGESAKMDGADEWRIFLRIYLPLSKPIMATLLLWTFVGKWNNWNTGVLYMSKNTKYQLIQTYLRQLMQSMKAEQIEEADERFVAMTGSMQMTLVIIGMVPIMLAYPFVQKYFVKGVMLGSVKG